MVIVMEMSTGRVCGAEGSPYGEAYGEEVLSAGWTEVPRLAPRLEEVVVAARHEPVNADIEGFLARIYANQE